MRDIPLVFGQKCRCKAESTLVSFAAERRHPLAGALKSAAERKQSYANFLAAREIPCQVAESKSLYISARGYVLLCCWLAGMLHNPENAETRQFAAEFGEIEDSGSIDGLKNSPEAIVMGDFFQREISSRWPKGSNVRLEVCARVCGK